MKRNPTKFYLIALFISIVSINSGCRKEGMFCEKGKGSTVTEQRMETGFTSVNVEMDATLFVTQGTEYSVVIEAQGNLMGSIRTRVKNNELIIDTRHCIRKHDPIKIHVIMPTVNGITVSGSGSAYTTSRIETGSLGITIAGSGSFKSMDSVIATYCQASIAGSGDALVIGRFTNVDTRISGSGNVTMLGVGQDSDIDISGSGDVHAYDMPVKTCSVTISGSGKAEVNVSDALDVSISGSGDVFYKGLPVVSVSSSGSGKIQHVP